MEKYRAYELIHARWAMLAAAGIIIPEGLQVSSAYHQMKYSMSICHLVPPAVLIPQHVAAC